MKKGMRLFVILVTLIFSTPSFAGRTLFQTVEATYVEGSITQDTVWTLVDSPFVVSKNITVYSNATLTIEPKVEVKFGGIFSLIVEGRLVAKGAEDKMITFTSNRYEPEAGDWGSIVFNGIESSSLMYCIAEYGKNGIIVESGTLNIQKSLVGLNSENGIMITGGGVKIENSEIVTNTLSGIYISGGNQVTVQNNNITSNGDGITLAGNLISEINIHQNEILLNEHSGILLEANAYSNTVIVDNTLSANSYGFYVSTNASTHITRNYVSNNTVGILYEEGKNHRAYFNDIYDNDLGMDTSPSAAVNATYNYWGDKSGPYHESLNPRGIGNPVGGNGVDLDFIFFLTAPVDYENTRPTAILWTDKTLVVPNQTVTFIGTDSYDEGRVDRYFFDFGDGTNSNWTTLSIFTNNFSSTGTYNAKLFVMDDFGVKSDGAVAVISVNSTLTPLGVSLALSTSTVNYDEEVLVTVYVSNGISPVDNANITLFSVRGGSFMPILGSTNSTGYFTTTFTAPNVTETTNVRIIGRASKTGYADGSNCKCLEVLPPLTVQVTAEPAAIKSEETAVVTVHVRAGFEQPVADALLILWSDYGNLSATIGVTDVNGGATFVFTAPQTLSQINVTIAATAIKIGYAEQHGQGTIIVEPKALIAELTADPIIIISGAVSTITAHVTYDTAPISNAMVTVSSDSGGNFSATTETTDSNGNARFVFTAPQTTTMTSATITVTATKSGYANGEEQTAITIVPKVLAVQVTAEPDVTVSEGKINVTVHVTHDMVSVPNASVTITSETGYFSATGGLTDLYGNMTFIFTAPQVNVESNITIVAGASKIGYASGESLLNITVNPGTLSVEVRADPSTIMSSESTVVTVYTKCNETPVANASVTVLSSDGTFSVANRTTDPEGCCTIVFNAPRTTAQLSIVIAANVTKNGYIRGENQTTINVTPEAGGWPLTTILLIIIPIAIVVIIVVLVKLKVITFSVEEES